MILWIAARLVVAMVTDAAVADEFAVYKSADRGGSWTRSNTGLPSRSRIHGFGAADEVVFAGTDAGIFVSGDRALHWRPATGAPGVSGRIISFATLGRSVFAGTDGNGLLVSLDRGASWVSESTFPRLKVRCQLALDGRIYVGTDADGVFVAPGVGGPWISLGAGLPTYAQVFALTAVQGRLFAGLYRQGLYAWDATKNSWAKMDPVKPLALASVQDTLIVGHNPGGIHRSVDLGVSWSKGSAAGNEVGSLVPGLSEAAEALPSEAPVWSLDSGQGLVFAGAAAGIYSSADRGRTWTRARGGLPARSAGIAFLLTADFILAGALVEASDDGSERPAKGRSPIRSQARPLPSADTGR